MERNYKDGNKDGKQTYYYENGQIKREENYKDGNRDGKHTYYYENGQIEWERNYYFGEEYLVNCWNINGEILVKDGNGKYISYYGNGQIQEEETTKMEN